MADIGSDPFGIGQLTQPFIGGAAVSSTESPKAGSATTQAAQNPLSDAQTKSIADGIVGGFSSLLGGLQNAFGGGASEKEKAEAAKREAAAQQARMIAIGVGVVAVAVLGVVLWKVIANK